MGENLCTFWYFWTKHYYYYYAILPYEEHTIFYEKRSPSEKKKYEVSEKEKEKLKEEKNKTHTSTHIPKWNMICENIGKPLCA